MKITLDELRNRVTAAVQNDPRFADKMDGDGGCRFWINEIIMDSGGAPWTAILRDCKEQKLSKLTFTLDGEDAVTLSKDAPTATEIIYAEQALGNLDTQALSSGCAVIECFSTAIQADDAAALPKEIMFAPGGISKIYPRSVRTGQPIEITVHVKPRAVQAINALLAHYKSKAANYRPFADKFHNQNDAAFWADGGVRWEEKFKDPSDGKEKPGLVVACSEWSKLGADSIIGKLTRCFSPAALTDADDRIAKLVNGVLKFAKGARGSDDNPAEIIGSLRCIGSLTNLPAFGNISPIFAESAASPLPISDTLPATAITAAAAATPNPTPATPERKVMKIKLTKDRGQDKTGSSIELPDAEALAVIAGGGAIHAADASAFEVLKGTADETAEQNKKLQEKVKAHDRSRGVTAVQAAIARRAIDPKAKVRQIVEGKEVELLYSDHLIALCESDPDNMIPVVEGMPGKGNAATLTDRQVKPETRQPSYIPSAIHAGGVTIELGEECSLEEAVRAYCGIQAETRKADRAGAGFEVLDEMRRSAGRIYERHLSKPYNDMKHLPIQAEWLHGIDMGGGGILADNSFGTLAATNIVAQETLLLLRKILLPFLKMSFDLSSKGAVLNQVIYTRTRAIPVVKTYSGSGNYADSDYASTDASVTLSGWPYVQNTISQGTIAATTRNIALEIFEPLLYALAKNIFEVWTGVMTVANFDKTATLARQGYTMGATPNRTDLVSIDNDGDTLLWPEGAERIVLFGTQSYNPLRNDPYLVSYLYAGPESSARTSGDLGKRENLTIHKTQSFNGRADGVKGFSLIASATVVAVRVPTQVNNAMGINYPGIRDIITEPDTGLSILLTKFMQPDGSSGSFRGEALVGANVADPLAGECVL